MTLAVAQTGALEPHEVVFKDHQLGVAPVLVEGVAVHSGAVGHMCTSREVVLDDTAVATGSQVDVLVARLTGGRLTR